MPLPLLPLALGAGLIALLVAKKGGYPHIPKATADAIVQNLATNNNPATLRALALSARMAAADAARRGDAAAAADYNRAAADLEAKAARLSQGGAPAMPGPVPGMPAGAPAADPVAAVDAAIATFPVVASTIATTAQAAAATPGAPLAIPPHLPSVGPAPSVASQAAVPPFVPSMPVVSAVPPFVPSIAPSIAIPPPFIPAAAPAAVPLAYKIASGDYAGVIAQRFGLQLHDLQLANPSHTNWNLIYPGQVLHLPPTAHDAGPRTHATGTLSVLAAAA